MQSLKRTAAATGVSESTIKRIRRETESQAEGCFSSPGRHRPQPPHSKCEIDEFDKCVIRQTIQEMYVQERKIPSIPKLIPILREKIDFPWKREILRNILHSMNFRWKKCISRRKFLMERADIVFWRNKYLRTLRKLRDEKRNIIYVDETWVDSNLTFGKCWQDENVGVQTDINSKNRLIVVHAGSENGFLPGAELIYKASTTTGDYHGQMNYGNFEKWVLQKLIPNLQPKSIIVMDNAPYHSKKKKDIVA